jgi:hypothetical protein
MSRVLIGSIKLRLVAQGPIRSLAAFLFVAPADAEEVCEATKTLTSLISTFGKCCGPAHGQPYMGIGSTSDQKSPPQQPITADLTRVSMAGVAPPVPGRLGDLALRKWVTGR